MKFGMMVPQNGFILTHAALPKDEAKPIKLIRAALPLMRKYVKEELDKTASKKPPVNGEDLSLSQPTL